MSGQPARTHEDIEAQIAQIQARRAERPDDEDIPKENERIGLSDVGAFDSDLYGATGKKKFEVHYNSKKREQELTVPSRHTFWVTDPGAYLSRTPLS